MFPLNSARQAENWDRSKPRLWTKQLAAVLSGVDIVLPKCFLLSIQEASDLIGTSRLGAPAVTESLDLV